MVLYIHTSEKTDRVTWQVTNTTGVPILGRTQAKHMNYVSYPEIHASVSQNSVKSTDYMHSLETTQCSLQSRKTAPTWTVDRLHQKSTGQPPGQNQM